MKPGLGQDPEQAAGNHRNGTSSKMVLTDIRINRPSANGACGDSNRWVTRSDSFQRTRRCRITFVRVGIDCAPGTI
jgi:hypothetical protein